MTDADTRAAMAGDDPGAAAAAQGSPHPGAGGLADLASRWDDPPSPAALRSAARVAARAEAAERAAAGGRSRRARARAPGTPGPSAATAAEPEASAAPTRPSAPQAPAQRAGAEAGRSIGRNTAVFSFLTGLSRIAGLIREVVAARYFGTGGPASAFTIAFGFPNLIRSLFADAALSAAFVPVFTELLEAKKRKEAFELASALLVIMVAVLGAITAFFIVFAGQVMPLFLADTFDPTLVSLTVGLSRVLFPIVLLLGVNGLVLGILNAYGEFSIGALAPLAWNAIIIACLVAVRPFLSGPNELYAYAIGVLAGTLVQLAMAVPYLRRVGFHFSLRDRLSPRDPRIRRIFVLMFPITVSLGIINFDSYLNGTLGTLVSEQTPRAIDAAFRVYMLPQGMFSVAVATVLFPALSRLAARRDLAGLRTLMGTGVRQIFLLLTPAAVFTAVLATPIVRLVYERGDFDTTSTDLVSTALFWFSFSLPFAGANLLLTRTFFSLQRPWLPTRIAAGNLVVNVVLSLLLYKPLGLAGLVIATAVASLGMTLAQAQALRGLLEGSLEGRAMVSALARIAVASAGLGAVSSGAWHVLDALLGRSLPAQAVAVGLAGALGFAAYAAGVVALRVAEAEQLEQAVRARLAARRSPS